jgi:hypothetical protein
VSGWTKAFDAILQQQVKATGVRVLVVEGSDDRMIVESHLDKIAPGTWAATWCVGVANGKQNVLRIVDNQTTWLGLVDRDEWSENAAHSAAADQARVGRLHVLPRFCMESYFILPREVWAALPQMHQAAIDGGLPTLEARVNTNLDSWLRHGALWHAVNPLWDGLRALGFKEALLDLQNAQNDAAIRQTLQDWHQFLDPQRVFGEFQTHLNAARAIGPEEQFQRWIHGKQFFRQVIVPALNSLIGPKSSDEWYRDLSRTLPPPADLIPLWRALGLVF